MANKNDGTVVMEGVQLIFRNFEGKERQYNRAGDRNFAVLLPEDKAVLMEADGWNVKRLNLREDEEDPDAIPKAYLPVKLGYSENSKPPRVVLISSRGRTNLSEENVAQLDWVDIQNADLIIRPYHWDVRGDQGTTAYLQSLYVTIEEDELELKYAALDEQ